MCASKHVVLFAAAAVVWGCSELPVGTLDADDGTSDAGPAGGASVVQEGGQGGTMAGGGTGGASLLAGGRGGQPQGGAAGVLVGGGGTAANTGGTPNTGGTGPNAGGTGGVANACTPARTTCSINMRTVCDATGTTTTVCEFGCLAGTTDCRECGTEGSIDCPSTTSSRTCVGGHWTATTACSATKICEAAKGCVCPAGQSALQGKCYATAGFSTPFAYLGNPGPGFLNVQKITIPNAGKVVGLGLLGQTGSGRARMVLYKDMDMAPSNLVAETAAFDVFKGAMNTPVLVEASVAAGTFWVGAVFETAGKINQDFNTSVSAKSRAQSFSGAFPSTFGSGTSTAPPPLNFYVLIE